MTLFKNNGKKTENKESSAALNLRRIFIGAAFGIIVFVLLILLFSLIMTFSSVPDSASLIFSFLAVAMSSFAAGFVSLWKIGKNGLINGLICGGILASLHLLLSLVFGDGGSAVYLLISVGEELILSTFGGIVSVNVAE